MAKEMNRKILVERDTYEKNGRVYFSYFIRGQIRGRDVRVQVMPPDFGGYQVLEIVFGENDAAELVVTPFEMKDETGKVLTGNTYQVRSCDENGEVYECKIKPSRASDKALLHMMLR